MSAGAQRAVQRSSAMPGDMSLQFDSTGAKPNYIQALRLTGSRWGATRA
jgi:hypothetical protein